MLHPHALVGLTRSPALALILLIVACKSLSAVTVSETVLRVIDGDTIEVADGSRVRLLWVDTPESSSNSHGEESSEGHSAASFLQTICPTGSAVQLWAAEPSLPTDRYGRWLAVIILQGGLTAQESIIAAGWSPYWRKYGSAQRSWPELHQRLVTAQQDAKSLRIGAWQTAPDYMQDKANESSAPSGVAPSQTTAPSGSFWLNTNSNTRHNAKCRYFNNTPNGHFCGPQEGVACGSCGG